MAAAPTPWEVLCSAKRIVYRETTQFALNAESAEKFALNPIFSYFVIWRFRPSFVPWIKSESWLELSVCVYFIASLSLSLSHPISSALTFIWNLNASEWIIRTIDWMCKTYQYLIVYRNVCVSVQFELRWNFHIYYVFAGFQWMDNVRSCVDSALWFVNWFHSKRGREVSERFAFFTNFALRKSLEWKVYCKLSTRSTNMNAHIAYATA